MARWASYTGDILPVFLKGRTSNLERRPADFSSTLQQLYMSMKGCFHFFFFEEEGVVENGGFRTNASLNRQVLWSREALTAKAVTIWCLIKKKNSLYSSRQSRVHTNEEIFFIIVARNLPLRLKYQEIVFKIVVFFRAYFMLHTSHILKQAFIKKRPFARRAKGGIYKNSLSYRRVHLWKKGERCWA